MPLPQPKVPLTDICSTVFNNTLYTYSADAFQALALESGAEWKKLPQGEKVTGGVCVGTTPGDPSTAALFVVGGKGQSADYQGLQKFTYSTGKWESVKWETSVLQDRLWHGATYINTTNSLLVYAGTQTGAKIPTSETYVIEAVAPYITRSSSSTVPAINPIILQWSPSEAVFIGGSPDNKKIMVIGEDRNWVDSGASLADPISKDTSSVQAIIMRGDDGSKSLYTFDMTEAPNTVKRTVLFSRQDVPVKDAKPVGRRSLGLDDDHLEERGTLTMNEWPDYNATLAPMATRDGFALAEDHSGLVVFAGGNKDDPLCMFDARENGWQNATARFAPLRILSDTTSSASSTLSTSRPARQSTATDESSTAVAAPVVPTQSATTQPVAGGGAVVSTNTILGAVLGAIFGLAILLFGIYWCIQKTRKRQAHAEAGHTRRASGFSADEKDPVGFANDSMARSLNAPGVFRGHQTQASHSSFSSMAILMGRVNNQKSGPASPRRHPSNNSNHSRNSSADSTFKAFKSTISKPIPQTAPTQHLAAARPPRPDLQPRQSPMREEKGVSFAANTVEPRSRNLTGGGPIDPEDSTRRSSGWNRYWSGGSALNLLGFGGNNNNGNAGTNRASRRETVESDGSHYSDRNRITQDSATVPPLQFAEPRASFSRVTTRSPTIAHHNAGITQGLQVQIETQRPVSAVSSMSGYSSGIPASVHDAWDPTEASKPWGADRASDARYNATGPGPYTTPLAPASSAARGQTQQSPMRDDMSWLNLGDGR